MCKWTEPITGQEFHRRADFPSVYCNAKSKSTMEWGVYRCMRLKNHPGPHIRPQVGTGEKPLLIWENEHV